MQQQAAAPAVVETLLRHYSERPPLPARAPLYVAHSPTEDGSGGGSTVIRFVRTAAGAAGCFWHTLTCSIPEEALWQNRQGSIRSMCTLLCGRHPGLILILQNHVQPTDGVAAACAAASVLWLPYTAFTLLVRSSTASSSPLADTGEMLLLMLACHAPAAGLLPPNPFRAALQTLQVPQHCRRRHRVLLWCYAAHQ